MRKALAILPVEIVRFMQPPTVRTFHRAWSWESAWPWLAALLAAATFLPTAALLPTRGEETRWATVAREMLDTGDWTVPRQQGEPFYSRPPMGSWLIALAGFVCGDLNLWAVRLPTALAAVGTAVGLMIYMRRWLTPAGAAATGLAFAFSLQILQLGRVAETDLVFTGLVAASMFGWHGLWASGRPTAAWIVGYGFAAAAALAKGPQAPVYFDGAVGLYLLSKNAWKALFRAPHFAGLAAFAAVMLAWHLPFYRAVGLEGISAIWSGDVKLRWLNVTFANWAAHLVVFPAELAAGFAPWSALLALGLLKPVRRAWWENDSARFALAALLIAFPTCWWTPGGKVRYFLPLFPALAVLAGTAFDAARLAVSSRDVRVCSERVARFALLLSALIGVGVVAASAAQFEWGLFVPPPLIGASVAAGAMIGAAARGVRIAPRANAWTPIALALLIAIELATLDLGVRMPMLLAKAVDTDENVRAVKTRLPADFVPVSIGPVHHRFAYYYRTPIRQVAFEDAPRAIGVGDVFFLASGEMYRAPPFAYDRLETVACDRNVKAGGPIDYVVIARRRADTAAQHTGHGPAGSVR